MKYILAIVTLFIAQIACAGLNDGEIIVLNKAHKVITEDLKDPSSAMFRGEYLLEKMASDGLNHYIVCGEINAKNSYGAYVGFVPYFVADNLGFIYTPATGPVITGMCSKTEGVSKVIEVTTGN